MMNYVRWPMTAAAALVMPISLGFPSIAQSSRRTADLSASLLDPAHTTCKATYTYSQSSPLEKKEKTVTMDNRVYTSHFRLWSRGDHTARLTCKINSDRFSVLRLQFGVDESYSRDNPLIEVNVFQDGQAQETYPMQVGSVERTNVDLKSQALGIARPKDISISAHCQRHRSGFAGYCYLEFLEAKLIFDNSAANPNRPEGVTKAMEFDSERYYYLDPSLKQ